MASGVPRIAHESPLAVPPLSRGAASEDQVLLTQLHAELRDGFDALAPVARGVAVFGSARVLPNDPDYELARAVCAQLGRLGFAIITGGGAGIMEAANRGARDAGTMSIGLLMRQDCNDFLDLPLRFHYFFARKLMFVRYASAFVVFPGGFGTLDELFELIALMQSGNIHAPPVVLVNRPYWTPMLDWLRDHALPEGKVTREELELVALADDVDEVCRRVSVRDWVGEGAGAGQDTGAEWPKTTT